MGGPRDNDHGDIYTSDVRGNGMSERHGETNLDRNSREYGHQIQRDEDPDRGRYHVSRGGDDRGKHGDENEDGWHITWHNKSKDDPERHRW